MLVGQRMIKQVITVSPKDTLLHASEVMRAHDVRHLPVMDGERLAGVITERDLRTSTCFRVEMDDEGQQSALGEMTVDQIMSTHVITADLLTPIEEAAKLFHDHRIGCLPVLSEGKLMGIITQTDILVAFIEIMGAHEPSSRLEVEIESAPGELAAILDVIKQHKTGVSSVVTTPSVDGSGRIAIIRLKTINPHAVVTSLGHAGFRVLWPPIR